MVTTILRLPGVKARTGLSRSTIYLRIKDGSFPTPVSLGPRAVGWPESEIEDWLSNRIRSSREAVQSLTVERVGDASTSVDNLPHRRRHAN